MAGNKLKTSKPGREVTTAQQLSGLCKKAIQVKSDSMQVVDSIIFQETER